MPYKCTVENLGQCKGLQFGNMESPVENISFYRINRYSKGLSFDILLKQPIGENIGVML